MTVSGKTLDIKRLQSGGLITNYYCTSRCAHCLYCCSPQRRKQYIDEETAAKNFEKIKGLGCNSVHVGGGEPLLDPTGLMNVVRTAARLNVAIEYVETNSSWFKNMESACALLRDLKALGLQALLISMSPFHNEFIPFYKVKGVGEACLRSGMSAYPWIKAFYCEIDSFDDRVPHSLEEYSEKFGDDYIRKIPPRYWVHLGGRALKTFEKVFPSVDSRRIVSSSGKGCSELADVGHFHLDLFGNYIPGLCSGLAIRRDDLGRPLSPDEYPILTLLYNSGASGLFEWAVDRYGFEPAERYLSRCGLCTDIRRFLVVEKGVESRELQPREFYLEC